MGIYGGIEISPDGSRVAYATVDSINYGQATGVDVLTIATGQTTLVDPSGTSPSWSPPGDRLAYLANTPGSIDGTLAIANPDGTNPTAFTSLSTFSPGRAWSPTAYVIGRNSSYAYGGLRVVRVRDGIGVQLLLPIVGQSSPPTYGDYS